MDDATCRECGSDFTQRTGRGRPWLFCSDECRKAAQRGYSKASRPQGEARCSPRRSATRTDKPKGPKPRRNSCVDCGHGSYGLRCRPCSDAARATGRSNEARRALERRRAARVRQAPGLTGSQRLALLARWVRQGRRCAYCPAQAQSVDHVIPIALGGTNYEGNLTPACLPCNSRKNDSLLIEWKHKRRVQRERLAVVVAPPAPRVVKGKTKRVHFPHCERCGVLFTARTSAKRFCSERCMRGKPETHACGDCGVEVPRTRRKCGACLVATKRERKRRYKRGLRARRRLERTLIAA